MNSATLDRSVSKPEIKRRLSKKTIPSPAAMIYVTFQRHRARVRKRRQAQRLEQPQPYRGIAFVDDVIVLDKHGRRVPTPDYANIPIDQFARFKKG